MIFFISFVRNNISFVRNIISFVRNIISFVRNIISFVRKNISFVQNIISFVRNNISFVRNDLGMSLTNRVGTWVWHSLTWCGPGPDMAGTWVWHSLTGRGPGTDTHWQGGYLGLTFTDRAGTWVWHSLIERGPGGDTHWQGGDLGLTLTDRAGTHSPSWQWVSEPGPRHVSECQTQVSALLVAGPDGSFVSTGACNLEVPGSNPGQAWYVSSWLCIYMLQTVQRHGMYSAAYGAVHYKEPLKSNRNKSRA